MKTKTIVGVSVLLASCAAMAADSPFEKGKTYSLFLTGIAGAFRVTVEIKDVKGKWILVNDKESCQVVNSNECWVNTDQFNAASPAK
jgi:hypothetical protein